MPKLLVIAAVSLLPLAAFADDAAAPAPTVEVNIYNSAPSESEPALAPPADAPVVAPQADEQPCARGWWRYHAGKRRGFIGIGFAKGHMALEDETDGRQQAVIVRAQGRRGFGIELELARAELGDDHSRTAGGSLFKAFGKRRLMPYVIAGGGRGVIERASGGEDRMRYMEAGGGLMLKLRRFAIGVDFRRGVRRIDESRDARDATAPAMGTASAVVTPVDDDDRAKYVRARVMALVTF